MRLGKCPACGKEGRLVVHHILYNPEFTVEICETCHYKAHAQVRKYHDNWFEKAFSVDEWLRLLGLEHISKAGLVETFLEKADEINDDVVKELVKRAESRFMFLIHLDFRGDSSVRSRFYSKLEAFEVAGLKYRKIAKGWFVVKTIVEAQFVIRLVRMCGGEARVWLAAPLPPSELLSSC